MTPAEKQTPAQRVAEPTDALALAERILSPVDLTPPSEYEAQVLAAALTELAERLRAAEADVVAVRRKMVSNAHNLDAAIDARNAAEAQRDEALAAAEQVPQLVEALERIEGYESRMGDYSEPEAYGVAFDCGEIARAALAKHRE